MSWQNTPSICAARDYGKKFKKDAVIILSFDKSERYELVTWGRDRKLCDATKKVGDTVISALQEGHINCQPVQDILNPIEELF
ncbi:hypothetical protein LCGC14_1874510 [marine sediment metagenome]|uniref:TPM domain-containing protein n=1 Tax=marine sediment metagenome TaxID=412755 RepID=A0A0F9J2R3_9ZZZZ